MLCKRGLLWGAVFAVSLLPPSWVQAQPANKDEAQRQIQDKTDRVNEAKDEAKRRTDDARENANQRRDDAQRKPADQRDRDQDATREPRNQRDPGASIVRPPQDGDRTNPDRATDRNRDPHRDRDGDGDRDGNRAGDRDRRGSDFGASFDMQNNRLRFSDISRDSIAARAGLRQGDIVLSVNGQRIDSRDAFDRYLYRSRVARVPIVVMRGNDRQTVYVDSGLFVREGRRFDDRVVAGGAWLGVFLDYDQPDRAMLRGIEPGSPADRAGLRAGDTIVRINDDQVRGPEDVNRLIGARRPGDQVELTLAGQARDSITVTLGSRPAPNRAIHVPAPVGVDVNVTPGRGVEVDVAPRGGIDVDVYRDRRGDRRGRR